MRLRDEPSTSGCIDIDAPAERIFELFTDLNLPAATSSEFQGAQWCAEETPGLGSHFVGRNQHPSIGSWQVTSTVTEWSPGEAFGYANAEEGELPGARWRYHIQPLGEGRHRVTQSVILGPGPSGLSFAIDSMPDMEDRILQRRLEEHAANMRLNLQHLKSCAEGR